MASYRGGYENERFEYPVSPNFHCPICMNVLKEPVMCRRNQHCFCRSCITKHLENSQTCPSCMEELTLETMRQAPRMVVSYLAELNIRCDYFSRGCHEFVQLERLESHVKDCGFAPVVCSNEGCLVEINKRDRAHHEAEVCELRRVECHNFFEMTKMMEDMKINSMETKDKLDEMENGLTIVKNKIDVMEKSMTAVQQKLLEIDQLKQQVDQLATLPDEIRGMKNEIMQEIRGSQQGETSRKPSIIVVGGWGKSSILLKSSELFDWSTRSWSRLQPMKECRSGASSFVYKSQITVTGGWTRHGRTNSMEQINIDPVFYHSAQWRNFPAKLSGKTNLHKTVVYNEKLIVIGGYQAANGCSESIYEVLLYPPYTAKVLATMPQPRVFHGVEIFDDKVFILGGSQTYGYNDTSNGVLVYDIKNNKCQQMTSLPIPVHSMATVKWGDNVILLGGRDKDGKMLNTVIIYNVKTGTSHMLPQMKYKRADCAAVVSGNTIVVMGGRHETGNVLKSVECFTFERYSWEELPSMNDERYWHIAVAL